MSGKPMTGQVGTGKPVPGKDDNPRAGSSDIVTFRRNPVLKRPFFGGI